MKRMEALFATVLTSAVVLGCGQGQQPSAPAADRDTSIREEKEVYKNVSKRASARIEARSNSQVSGTATFLQEDGSTTLQVDVQNAPPGALALHIHENGDCSAPDGSSAGGHWNPTHEDHGKWNHAPHHLGDIGNAMVDEAGTGTLMLTTEKWEIGTGGARDIVGKSVILHEKADDFTTQPTGNAGGRIGCGIIKLD